MCYDQHRFATVRELSQKSADLGHMQPVQSAVGSSKTMNRLSLIKAQAIASLCF